MRELKLSRSATAYDRNRFACDIVQQRYAGYVSDPDVRECVVKFLENVVDGRMTDAFSRMDDGTEAGAAAFNEWQAMAEVANALREVLLDEYWDEDADAWLPQSSEALQTV